MRQTLWLSSLAVLALSGCTSIEERRIASGSYQYTQVQQQTPISVPVGLDAPLTSAQYDLPHIVDNGQGLGKQLPVVSPALILTTARGTYLEDGSETTSVVIDKLDNEAPVDTFVLQQITGYLDAQGITFNITQNAPLTIRTNWITEALPSDSPWYSLEKNTKELGKRFAFTIVPAQHGRTAEVEAVLTDFVIAAGDDLVESMDAFVKRELEADILNGILQRYAQSQQLQAFERMAQIRSGIESKVGFDKHGNAAIIAKTQYDIAWPKFQLVLRKLGFNVKDLDKSNGLVFVNYQGEEDSAWFSFFGKNEGLSLAKKDYRIMLKPLGADQTTITFMDEQSTPFTPAKMTQIYPNFAAILQQDDLDL